MAQMTQTNQSLRTRSAVARKNTKPSSQSFEIAENLDGINLVHLSAGDGTSFIIVTDLTKTYRVEPNSCFRLQMLPITNSVHLQLDGYRCHRNEIIDCSTCFAQTSLIKFVVEQSITKLVHKDSIFLSLEACLGANFQTICDYRTSLLRGQAVLLKLEHNVRAINQYKLVLSYMLKASLDPTRHEMISNHLHLNLNQTDRLYLKPEVSEEALQLNERLDCIFDRMQIKPKDIVVVYGANNCGKSSLVHHIINRYLSDVSNPSSIQYLECDPGQTEFTSCGILSLVKLSSQIVATPGFKYILNPSQQCFTQDKVHSKIFGTTSPSGHENHYKSVVEQLLAKYFSSNCQEPLVINTMGWVEDLGLRLLLHIIQAAKPTKIVRVFKRENETFPFTAAIQEIQNNQELDSLPGDLKFIDMMRRDNRARFELFCVPSCTLVEYKYSPFRQPKTRRAINQLAYMVVHLWPKIAYLPFHKIKPIRLPISETCLYILDNPLRQSLSAPSFPLLDLLHSSWVLLGHIDGDLTRLWELEQSLTNMRLLNSLPSSAVCLGCGIVRGINAARTTIDIVTPFTESNVINLIVLPSLISIPAGLSNEQFLTQRSSNLAFHPNL